MGFPLGWTDCGPSATRSSRRYRNSSGEPLHGVINFHAKPHQAAVLNDKTRHRCVVMHRRAGKTVTAVFALIEALLTCSLPHPRVRSFRPS